MSDKIMVLAKVFLARFINEICLYSEKSSVSFESLKNYLESYKNYKPSLCACMGSIDGLCYCRASSELSLNLESLKTYFDQFNVDNFNLSLVEQKLGISDSYFAECKASKTKQSESLLEVLRNIDKK